MIALATIRQPNRCQPQNRAMSAAISRVAVEIRTSPTAQCMTAMTISRAVPSPPDRVEPNVGGFPNEMADRSDGEVDRRPVDRPACGSRRNGQSGTVRKRSAFPMTVTELIAIAALAIIGFSSSPNAG